MPTSAGRGSGTGPRLPLIAGLVPRALAAGSPPLLLAAVVHGELLAVNQFPGPNGVVARAASRLTLLASGFDPRGLIAPEIGHLAREPEYVGSLNAMRHRHARRRAVVAEALRGGGGRGGGRDDRGGRTGCWPRHSGRRLSRETPSPHVHPGYQACT